jgi:Protein of unknown function (DUF1194)
VSAIGNFGKSCTPRRASLAPIALVLLAPIALVLLALLAGLRSARAEAADRVDLALVMAVDVSESVDGDEYTLQHEGIARAFDDPQLLQAIASGKHGAIAVAVMEWSDRDKQAVTVDWTLVRDGPSAAAFAAAVRASRRSSDGLTAIGDALLAAQALLGRAPVAADRRLVDLSGDGIANIGLPVQAARDELVAAGITINGLAILASEPWLESYYKDYVIGGPGAFLLQAEDFSSFANAMQNKLLSEVVGLPPRPSGRLVAQAAAFPKLRYSRFSAARSR